MNKGRVVFRVDANKRIGTGHFFRCLYLSMALKKKGFYPAFLMVDADGNVPRILDAQDFDLIRMNNDCEKDSRSLINYLTVHNLNKSFLVVDCPNSPFYVTSFQDEIRRSGNQLMLITFRNECHFKADIIHNQNLLALKECYSAEPYTRLLLGPNYVVLDDRYGQLRKKSLDSPAKNIETLFLFFGGADLSNLTLKVLKTVARMKLPLKRIITIVGQLHSQVHSILDFIDRNPSVPIDLFIDTPDMPELMSEADLAVTSGGLCTWEMSAIGIPAIIISTSDRERIHAPFLEKKGVCVYLGHKDEVTEESICEIITALAGSPIKRMTMSQAGSKLIDGNGTARVVEQILEFL